MNISGEICLYPPTNLINGMCNTDLENYSPAHRTFSSGTGRAAPPGGTELNCYNIKNRKLKELTTVSECKSTKLWNHPQGPCLANETHTSFHFKSALFMSRRSQVKSNRHQDSGQEVEIFSRIRLIWGALLWAISRTEPGEAQTFMALKHSLDMICYSEYKYFKLEQSSVNINKSIYWFFFSASWKVKPYSWVTFPIVAARWR